MKCSNEGCSVRCLTDDESENHQKTCVYKSVICPLDNEHVLKKDLLTHLAEKCTRRIINCKDCDEVFMKIKEKEHQKLCQRICWDKAKQRQNYEEKVKDRYKTKVCSQNEIEDLKFYVEDIKNYDKKLRIILRKAIKRRMDEIRKNIALKGELEEIKNRSDEVYKEMKKEITKLGNKIEENGLYLEKTNEELTCEIDELDDKYGRRRRSSSSE